jgi:hypothetical protein
MLSASIFVRGSSRKASSLQADRTLQVCAVVKDVALIKQRYKAAKELALDEQEERDGR